jgi:hypothetical protein
MFYKKIDSLESSERLKQKKINPWTHLQVIEKPVHLTIIYVRRKQRLFLEFASAQCSDLKLDFILSPGPRNLKASKPTFTSYGSKACSPLPVHLFI